MSPSNKFVQKRRPLCFFVCMCVCCILVLSSLDIYEHLKIKTLLSFIAWSICPPRKTVPFGNVASETWGQTRVVA